MALNGRYALITGVVSGIGVVKDGYEALMNGDDMVISGFKTKMQIAGANITPDSMVADNTKKM